MTDRDTFAAAALSGILTKDDAAQLEKMASWWPEWACSAAYRWADAMLRERSRAGTTSQSHEESDEKRMNTNTNRDTTPSEGSVQGEFTDTVFKTLVERISLTQSLLDENERLREAIRRLAEQDATLSVCDGNVTVTLDATLTDAERETIAQTIDAAIGMASAEPWTISTLRSLLERMK